MDTSWWRSEKDLDPKQRDFILLPREGKFLLSGPPGSGKTNLLLLRAQFIAGTGLKNVLVISFTKSLTDFIRTGIAGKGLMSDSQVKTYHSWAFEHILQHLGIALLGKDDKWDDALRLKANELIKEANKKIPAKHLYDAIFVDEAQDFDVSELENLLCLSPRICICGDLRQGIYNRDGLNVAANLGLTPHVLEWHYRIGHRIAQVADKLLPPADGAMSLEQTCNYNAKEQGESTAVLHECADRDEQFARMCELISIQLDAFKGDSIGILCGKKETALDVVDRLSKSPLADEFCFHGKGGGSFSDGKRIHVMKMHSAKGTEFRAVHLFGIEDLRRYPLNRTKLAYTAVTRAKTALNAFRSGPTSPAIESAFALPALMTVSALFPESV